MATVYSGNNTAMQNLMSRNTALAGQTVSKNGYNVTYDSNGYATSAAKITGSGQGAGGYAAPSADAVLGSAVNSRTGGSANRADYGGSSYDQQHLSNTDLQNIADVRALAQSGAISWTQANDYANNIRSQYGYTGGTDGSAYIPTGGSYAGGDSAARSAASAQSGYSGGDPASQLQNLYSSQNSAYQQQLAAQKAAQEAAVQKAVSSLESQKTSTDAQYSDLFRQLYIDKMKSRKNLDQRLAASGITGGAAESAMLGYDTAYEDALRQGEQGRISAIGGLDQAIADARLTGDIESANAAAKAAKEQTSAYADALKTLISRQDALDARQAAYEREDAAANRSYAYKAAMQLLNSGNMPSAELLASAGIDAATAQAIVAAVQAERIADAEAAAKPALTSAQVNQAIRNGILSDRVLAAYEYYYGEPYHG
ncbi:MAG: hypothetical protein IJV43_09730 [Oscillospiraceae bacterium]|nr:hypothetical protein [Oscillospiraceae bacterium]